MNKLRSDAVFSQLTPEQLEMLEGWLFEERLGYKEVLERVKNEFGLAGSQSALARFYQRLAVERSRENLVEIVGACVEATGAVNPPGALQSGLLTLANKCAVQLAVESPDKVKEFTALLRALTSAQGMEMKRIPFQREEDKRSKGKVEDEPKEGAY